MMPTKNLIAELQNHFSERGRLVNAQLAIKCYTQDASFFFSYKDGYGNKKYINLPFTPEDVLPILQKYIDDIEKDIICSSIEVDIDSEDDLNKSINEYRQKFPTTFKDLETVKQDLKKKYATRLIADDSNEEDEVVSTKMPYRVKACSDRMAKTYEFLLVGRCKNTLLFGFNGINEYGRTTKTDKRE